MRHDHKVEYFSTTLKKHPFDVGGFPTPSCTRVVFGNPPEVSGARAGGWDMGHRSVCQWKQDRGARAARAHYLVAAVAIIAGCAAEKNSGDRTNSGTTVGVPASQPMAPSNPMTPTAGSGGGTAAAQPTPGTQTAVTGVMPCAVDRVVETGCQTCHGATPIGGAPMSLLSLADFQRDYTAKTTKQLSGQTMRMYELARIRINREMGTSPMPQGAPLSMDAFTTLDGWLSSGAPAGSACGGTGVTGTGMTGTTGAAGSGGTQNPPLGTTGKGNEGSGATMMEPVARTQCDDPKSFEPLVAKAGETCWEFQTHGISSPTDKSKFTVPVDESYNQFYFNVPWPAGSVETRFGTDLDNKKVLHHWLMFTQSAPTAAGTVSTNVTGTTLFEGAELIAGWAIGGCSTTYPDDVGVALPDSGTLMIQWHHFNSTGTPQQDGSKVQVCTVPAGSRAHIAGLTFLGTEAIVIPPGKADATGTCQNSSGGPITIIGLTPHMHKIGINMRSVVDKAGGGSLEIFNKPFVFDQQINYMLDPPYVLQPGDSITSTCTFQNNSDATVGFGQSTTQEMCYQFALSYPYGALNNAVFSLIGATNTCW
jgi:hypothetical protein